ncbi:MAG: GDSL-type esterase/lipase family protein [Actinomycetota bacterium]
MGRVMRTAAVLAIVAIVPACTGRDVTVPRAHPAGTPAVTACGGPPGSVPLLGPGGGGCVPIARLSMWTCEGTGAPPFARRSIDGRSQRYVGGRFAVPVPEIPPSATPIGIADDLELFADPADARWLWVRRAGSAARWLALPDRAPDDPADVFFIGDSIADGAAGFFPAALVGWVTGFDAVPGRGSVGGIAPAASQAPLGHDAVVVELGTNDRDLEGFRANAEAILSSLAGVPLVLWQTVKGPPDLVLQRDVNRVIRDLAQTYPNVAIVDWAGRVHDDELSSDGVHPIAEHLDLMVTLVAPQLNAWLAAARRPPSADRCAATLSPASID